MRRLFLAPLILAGCATQQFVWTKPGGSEADFYQDSGQCRAQAFGVSGVSLPQAVLVFENCLAGKGWYRRPA
jgi:hypothetical protein